MHRLLGTGIKVVLTAIFALALQACGGGGGDAGPAAVTVPVRVWPVIDTPPTGVQVSVTGIAKFSSVPNGASGALNYAAATDKPARGVTVQAISQADTVLASAVTSETGAYTLTLPDNTAYFLRLRAELIKNSPSWNVAVYDNTGCDTNSCNLWVVEGVPVSSGTSNNTRHITAGSGWGGSSYTAGRAAGPFAILDTIYDSMKLVSAVRPAANFPQLFVFWSPNNTTATGDFAVGNIGTSFFSLTPSNYRVLYILGKDGVDTDEYDSSVIAHEYGHYLQSAFATDHSMGGAHGGIGLNADRLDMSLAFSEGWGNAFSSMARNNPIYADSSNSAQASGFTMNLSATPNDANRGWYREDSVGTVLYGLFASQTFTPIWDALTGPMKTSQNALSSIFSFREAVSGVGNATVNTDLNSKLSAQAIHATDQWGTSETNSGGNASHLPIYNTLAFNTPTSTCFNSTNGSGGNNKLGTTKYYRHTLSAANAGLRTITANFANGRDIDFEVFQNRVRVASARVDSLGLTSESSTVSLVTGEVIIRVTDYITSAPPVAPNCANLIIQ